MKARAYVKELMAEAGLAVHEDTMGSIFGVLAGSEPGLAAVGTGSHCDAIPLAGAYDGTVGVLGGIAALKALRAGGFVPRRPIEVIMFTSEEPTRFGLSCSSSRAMGGVLDPAYLEQLRDANGTGYLAAARSAGYGAETTAAMVAGARLTGEDMAAFLELHIEQGPELEAKGLEIGVVSAIAAPAALEVTFEGDGGHAGAQLMPLRNDASLGAAELALFLEKTVLDTNAIDAVGTAGAWRVGPNAVNSVPREATLGIDVRDVDGARRDAVVGAVLREAEAIAARRRLRVRSRILNQDPPASSGEAVLAAAQGAADALGYSSQTMVSRAYHDSLFMAQVCPVGMLFIPCRNGWSHRPDEFAAADDIERGVKTLAVALATLAGEAQNAHQEL